MSALKARGPSWTHLVRMHVHQGSGHIVTVVARGTGKAEGGSGVLW